jgi:hypothetical protein
MQYGLAMSLMFIRSFACVLALEISPVEALCAEWRPLEGAKGSPFVSAGFKHDDGGSLIVACDTQSRLISIVMDEPRANWRPGATLSLTTRADDGSEQKPASTGLVIGPARLIIKDEATWDLSTAGRAKVFFATGVGGYARIWPAANFKTATDSVLKACGDHW